MTAPARPHDLASRYRRPGPSRLKWHHIYYLLAAFDLATISFSLYLNHQILTIYTQSVVLNQGWAERMGRYADLAQLAASVNAPGNDVFDTRDVERESARLDAAMRSFLRSFTVARTDLTINVDESVAAPLEEGLDRVDAALRAMVSESQLIFTSFEQNEPEIAGRRMAEMDRKYAQVRAELDDLQREVREIQEGNFSRQTAAAVGLGRYEYIVGGFIVLMVAAVTLYGHRLARKMQSTQRQLVRQERLAALGEVAATIAHGMRNPLASIRAAAEVGRADLTEGSALSETLDDIVAEVDRLASRIRTVIDFAHPLEPRLARGDLNGFISGFADGARKRLPEAVCMHVALDPAVPAMQFDRAHMQEVLEALVVNAVEAMDGNGQVTIGSTLERDADTGRSVILSVEDTGSGIEASRIGRIFDLFYTSKPSGTGIGLAMAKRLVEVHGGEIEVASQPGHRTTFSVRLPVPQPPTVTRV